MRSSSVRPRSPGTTASTSTRSAVWTARCRAWWVAPRFHLTSTIFNYSPTAIFRDSVRLPDIPAVPSQCVDLSSWGLSSQSDIIDNVIVEVTPAHQVAVGDWSVADHIDVAAANVNWHGTFPDVIHMNSIAYDGAGGVIFSSRHLDAVYRVDMATGDITWKLGGSTTPQSLRWVGGGRGPVGLLRSAFRPSGAERRPDRPGQRIARPQTGAGPGLQDQRNEHDRESGTAGGGPPQPRSCGVLR